MGPSPPSQTRSPSVPQLTAAGNFTTTAARFNGTSMAPATGSTSVAPAGAPDAGDPSPDGAMPVRSVSGAHALDSATRAISQMTCFDIGGVVGRRPDEL